MIKLKRLFVRRAVLKIDSNFIELTTTKNSFKISSNVNIDSKGIVVRLDGATHLKGTFENIHIFDDTIGGSHTLILNSFFKKILSPEFSWLLRPRILLIISDEFKSRYGSMAGEYIALILGCFREADVFIFEEKLRAIGFVHRGNRQRTFLLSYDSVDEKGAQRVLNSFKDFAKL